MVTLIEAVDGTFDLSTERATWASHVSDIVSVVTERWRHTVTITLAPIRLSLPAAGANPAKDESETHHVAGVAVPHTLAPIDMELGPARSPKTVIIREPVAGAFTEMMELSRGRSDDRAREALPN